MGMLRHKIGEVKTDTCHKGRFIGWHCQGTVLLCNDNVLGKGHLVSQLNLIPFFLALEFIRAYIFLLSEKHKNKKSLFTFTCNVYADFHEKLFTSYQFPKRL